MADLTDEQKKFLVVRRAHCVEIADIIGQFKEVYGITLKTTQVSVYDATTVHGRERMGKDLQALFHEERKTYLRTEPLLANPNMRLLELEKMFYAPSVSGGPKSDKIRTAILEQIAKEKGGLYRQRVSEQEAFDMVTDVEQKARDAVDKHVTNSAERNRVHADIKKELERQSPGSTA